MGLRTTAVAAAETAAAKDASKQIAEVTKIADVDALIAAASTAHAAARPSATGTARGHAAAEILAVLVVLRALLGV